MDVHRLNGELPLIQAPSAHKFLFKLFCTTTYQEVGNSINQLALQIGWRSQNKWLRYDKDFNFDLSAPEGHLPAAIFNELGFSVNAILSRCDF